MRRFYFYVSKGRPKQIREEAKNLSVSKCVAEAVQRETHPGWPEGYFEQVVGKWQGEPLERPEQLPFEERDLLFWDT